MKWEVLDKSSISDTESVVNVLLKNRGIKGEKQKEEFFSPTLPSKILLKFLGVKESEVKKAIARIKKAKKNKEFVIVYGDYDADGITATAIMWEALHSFGLDVLPHIPDRFEEGYGINAESIQSLKTKIPNLKLIVTVDNGIVGYEGIESAKKLGIDVIVVDHHTKGTKNLSAQSVIHTTMTSGSGLAWFFARELIIIPNTLELAAIGVIADQIPLIGVNRSIVKYGLQELNNTKRPGLLALFKEARIEKVGVYEVGYMIAPRINAMGRLKNGIESLRLLCTKNKLKAFEIAKNIGGINSERQKIVEEVLLLARKKVTNEKIIVISGENYHEGVIGLAAGRLVEEFYRPAIVFSVKGDISKASARSVVGFNIIEAIRGVNLHLEGGGHPMAAGFSIETEKIDKFTKEINRYASKLLTNELLSKKLRIDCKIGFDQLNYDLIKKLDEFEPTGLGNPGATFMSKRVEIISVKPVGREARHLKMKLKQDEYIFDSIFFGGGEMYSKLIPNSKIDIVYQIEENIWNGYKSIQLKIKDINKN
ncbi:MAG: single-stranded-DNA-specific exonuclease RecJ [Candidatus Microgenomates bacterium]|jgi:single-stranded-DNA-specific exonuclease